MKVTDQPMEGQKTTEQPQVLPRSSAALVLAKSLLERTSLSQEPPAPAAYDPYLPPQPRPGPRQWAEVSYPREEGTGLEAAIRIEAQR